MTTSLSSKTTNHHHLKKMSLNPKKVHWLPITIASFFGTGFSPIAPGTIGSLFGLIPLYLISLTPVYIATTAVIIIMLVGIYATHKCTGKNADHDPSWIVIDEVVGIMMLYPICFQFVSFNITNIILAFLIFRALDISKIGPIGYVEKKFRNAWGVMLDDVAASILTTCIMLTFYYLPV